ncbi:MAG: lipooligosaccharide sialyltransferase [Lachnospiraceae bacterium]|nr:lipooligosaccharide sialyltransferase [Lachnospiraceae bacterium]
MKERIYVCHTYYHVYVTFLKELNLPKEQRGKATLLLSKMSIDFENLKERVESTGLFEEVMEYDEKRADFFPELAKYTQDRGNIVSNMLARIQYTKKLAKLNAPYVPVDFKQYKDIYVFCDIDPVGYYLNWKKIPYHAVEDGLNTLQHCDMAWYDNRGHFKLKVFLSEKCNLIFIQNGYGKYCLDMEVNDISVLKRPCDKYVEVNRQKLVDALTQEDKELILQAFIRDREELQKQIEDCGELTESFEEQDSRKKRTEPSEEGGKKHADKILILTEPLCDMETRERIFRDIIEMYEPEGKIFIKPHPRDTLNYREKFAEYPQFDATVPMEMLNFFPGLRFKKVVGVLTETSGIHFADESVRLGPDFMDKYEDPAKHDHSRV